MLILKFLKNLFCFLIIVGFLSSCGGLVLDDETDRRRDDREGDIELPEDLLGDIKDICENEDDEDFISVPRSSTDILTEVAGIDDYAPRKYRDCLAYRLEKGNSRICDTKDQLERARQKTRDDSTKDRIDRKLERLERIQAQFNDRLYRLAGNCDRSRTKLNEKDSSGLGEVVRFLAEDETSAYCDIFESESYALCSFNYEGYDDY